MTGKYDSQRDEVLHALALNGWANESTGSDDFGGSFDLIVNDAQDVALNNGELVSLFESMEFDFELDSTLSEGLVGTFVVFTAESGAVSVVSNGTPEEIVSAFRSIATAYDEWMERED